MHWLKQLFGKSRNEVEDDQPPSAILEMLEQEQIVYFDLLTKLVQEVSLRDINATTEAPILLEAPNIPPFFRQSRADVLHFEDGEYHTSEALIANPPNFNPIIEIWQGVEIILHPFVWHNVEFRMTGPQPDTQQLQNWLTKWQDLKNRNVPNEAGLHHVCA